MAQVIAADPRVEGQKALEAVMRVLGYDAELADRFWSMKDPPGFRSSPEAIGEDVLMKLYPLQTLRTSRGQTDPILRNIPPAAATVMHLGREMATPINTGLSLIPALQALRQMRRARTATPSAPVAPPVATAPSEESPSLGGVTRRDVLKGLALAPVIAAGAATGGKVLERLLTKEPSLAELEQKYGMKFEGKERRARPTKSFTLGERHEDLQLKAEAKGAMAEMRAARLAVKYEKIIEDAVRGGDLVPKGAYSVFQPSNEMRKAFDGLERMRKAGQYEGKYAKLIDERMKMKILTKKYDKLSKGLFDKGDRMVGSQWERVGGVEVPKWGNRLDKLGMQMQKQAERVWQEWSKLQQ